MTPTLLQPIIDQTVRIPSSPSHESRWFAFVAACTDTADPNREQEAKKQRRTQGTAPSRLADRVG